MPLNVASIEQYNEREDVVFFKPLEDKQKTEKKNDETLVLKTSTKGMQFKEVLGIGWAN